MMRSDGSPVLTAESNTRTVREGDVETDPNKQEAAPPPSLRNPGEKLPTDNQSTGVMRPVQFPKPHPDEMPGANPDEQSTTPPAATPPPGASTPPASGSQPQSTPAKAPAPGNTPPAGSNQLVSAGTADAVTN